MNQRGTYLKLSQISAKEAYFCEKASEESSDTCGTIFHILIPGGGGVLPYKGLMGTCGQLGMFFGIFVLNRVSILSFFVLIRVLILSIFVLNRVSFFGR